MKTTDDMESHLGKMEAQLKTWGADLDGLLAKAQAAGAEAKLEQHQRIEELKEKHQKVQARLDELKAQHSEKWSAFKVGVEGAWKELEAAFKHLTS